MADRQHAGEVVAVGESDLEVVLLDGAVRAVASRRRVRGAVIA